MFSEDRRQQWRGRKNGRREKTKGRRQRDDERGGGVFEGAGIKYRRKHKLFPNWERPKVLIAEPAVCIGCAEVETRGNHGGSPKW